MRIISKQKDYYDCIQRYGQDQNQVYVRNQIKLPREQLTQLWGDLLDNVRCNIEELIYGQLCIFDCHIIGFCGKIYPVIGIKYINYARLKDYQLTNHKITTLITDFQETFFAYTFDELLTFLEFTSKKYVKDKVNKYYNFRSSSRIKQIFSKDFNRTKYSKLFIDHNIPIFIVKDNKNSKDYSYSRYNNIYLNPFNLYQYKFQKIFSPFEAYQELEMYISNFLRLQEPTTIEVSEKDKISKHGFDKYSFRKSPSKKK